MPQVCQREDSQTSDQQRGLAGVDNGQPEERLEKRREGSTRRCHEWLLASNSKFAHPAMNATRDM